jgi:hypothetical protein
MSVIKNQSNVFMSQKSIAAYKSQRSPGASMRDCYMPIEDLRLCNRVIHQAMKGNFADK